jgi:phenylalanyl-tRNA synthetase beta subunit
MLSNELITELKEILVKDFKRKFTSEEIFEIAHVFVEYFDLLAKIDHQGKEVSL